MMCVSWVKFINILSLFLCTSQTILDVDELSVQYGIEITNKPVILNSQPVDENVLHLSSKHGQLYSCFLPQLPQDDDQEPSNGNPVENVVDILDKSLNGTCITHKKGWWTYKLCHKKSLTQYHVGELGDVDGPTTNIGLYSSEDDWSKEEVLQRKPSEIFHSHQFVNGDVCDVTGESRRATVQYFCATKSTDSIIRIEEPATCEYIVTVHNTKLCSHSLFSKKETRKQINLICSPALMEHEYNKYLEKLNKKKAAEEEKKKEVLKKKIELDEAEKNAKVKDTASVNGEFLQLKDDKDGKGLKDAMNDISSFMKGFMKGLNIKSDDVKLTTKVITDGKEVETIKENINIDDLDTEFKELTAKGVTSNELIKDGTDIKDAMNIKDPEAGVNEDKLLEKSKDSLSGSDKPQDLSEQDPDVADIMKDLGADHELLIPNNDKLEKPESLKFKSLNDMTEMMIRQLERDSERMQKKSTVEREVMHREFERVRKNAIKELGKSQNMLTVLESLKKEGKSLQSKKDIDKQIKQVRTLIENLQAQIITIDEKRKTVDTLEKDTNKRLEEINKKIMSTKAAHKFAKSLESMTNEKNSEEYFKKIINGIFDKENEKKGIAATTDAKSEKIEDDLDDDNDDEEDDDDSSHGVGKEDGKKAEIGGDDDVGKDPLIDTEIPPQNPKSTTSGKEERSNVVKKMINNLKDEVKQLNNDMKYNRLRKGDTGVVDGKGNADPSGGIAGEYNIDTKKGLNSLVEKLKEEMTKINEKIKKEKDNVSPAERSKDESEKEIIEETEKDAKNNMEVRIRTIDEKSLDKDFDKDFDKSVDESVREEVKEATKKMEETVKKQLKDAGLDFSDNIKIKIITTKDKFDQFSNGKDVKLLSDDDAADFKDLLLGFLGGGKDKVTEEQRQKVLEENYNFVLDDEE